MTPRVPSVETLVNETRAISLADVQQVARELIAPDRLVLAAGGPRRAVEQARKAFCVL